MRESRNPFRLRAAEQIESDSTFARLFEPGLLDAIPAEALTVPLTVFQSAPGAGKSSLLRLFTPSVLEHVRQNSQREEYRELSSRLTLLGALSRDSVKVLGVQISCAQTFANLEELDGTNETASLRMFMGLLNARIVLGTLRAGATHAQLPLQQWLDAVKINPNEGVRLPGLSFPCSGADLYAWASIQEEEVTASLDNFGPPVGRSALRSADVLSVVSLFTPTSVKIQDVAWPERVLILLDDVQWLTERQRSAVRTSVLRTRAAASVWMAERYDSLGVPEILEGTREGRDIATVRLENFWRQPGNRRKLEHFLRNVGNRRSRAATEADVLSLDDNLREILEGPHWRQEAIHALATVRDRVMQSAGNDTRFTSWFAEEESRAGSEYERLLSWRRLEILIRRVESRTQLDFGLALDPGLRAQSDGSDVGAAAALFLAREFEFPYYFGVATLVSLSSSNVEQYLRLAGDFFEEMASASLLGRSTHLIPTRQDRLVRDAAASRWREIPSRTTHGRAVQRFLLSAATFAERVTYRPTAPYTPGVTGFAYLMQDQERLYRQYPELASVLAAAVADNLLEMIPDYSCKGKQWMLYYFNRLVCVQFGLPLGYGGFREQRLETLQGWLTGTSHSIQHELMRVPDVID